jgi:hypothetical protein
MVSVDRFSLDHRHGFDHIESLRRGVRRGAIGSASGAAVVSHGLPTAVVPLR